MLAPAVLARAKRRLQLCSAIVSLAALLPGSALAQSAWTGAANNDFSNGSNWSSAPAAPGAADAATIAAGTPTVSSDAAVDTLSVSGGSLHVDATLSASGGTTLSDMGRIEVSTSGTLSSDVTMTGGYLGVSGTLAGDLAASGGTVINDGAITGETYVDGAAFTNNGSLRDLIIASGSDVTNNGGASVTGATTIADGTLTNNGSLQAVTVGSGSTFTNNATGSAGAVSNSGTASNAGTIASLTNLEGSFSNNSGGRITGETVISGGSVTNNFVVTDVDVAAAAAFINNSGAEAGAVTNAGTSTNAGTVASLTNTGGTFTNNDGGEITGTTTVTGGTVVNNFVVSDVDVAAAAAFVNNSGAEAGAVSNAGQSSNAGTVASLTNTGGTFTNDEGGEITGTTTVNGGTVINNFIVNDVDVAAAAAFINNSGAVAGDVTNAGTAINGGEVASLTNTGGTFTNNEGGEITGTTTVTGGTVVNNFVVNDVDVAAAAAFVNNSGAVAGAVTNAGQSSNAGTIASLTNTGGTFANTGTITDSASVTGGTLVNDGSIGGEISVGADGTLSGTGSVGGLTVASGGTLSPGPGIATLAVNGDVTFKKGSTYEVETDASGASDKVAAAGSVSIEGGKVSVLAGSGHYSTATTYTILTGSEVSGAFDTVTTDLAFLSPFLTYGTDAVTLGLYRNDVDFADVADTANGRATARAVQSLGTANSVFLGVLPLNAETARDAFYQLSGETHVSTKTVLLDQSRFARDAILDRATAIALPDLAARGEAGFWMQGFATSGRMFDDGNARGLGNQASGLVAGFDAGLTDDWRLGGILGYNHASAGSEADWDSYHAGLYALGNWGPLGLATGAIVSHNEISTRRDIAFGAFLDSLTADYGSDTKQVFADLSWWAKAGPVVLQPFANIAYVDLGTDGFTEKGGAAALSASGSSDDITTTTLGLRWSADLALDEMPVGLSGMVGWRHAIGDITPSSTLAFLSGGSPFVLEGVAMARDSLVAEASISAQVSKSARVKISYTGEFANSLTSHAAKASLVVKF